MRAQWSVLVIATVTLGTSVLVPVAPVSAAVPVTSSGPSVINTYTYQDSEEGYAVFTVTDPSRQGTQVSQCWVDSDDDLYDCDVYPLRETDYRGGDWRIRSTASGWEIRVYVAYYAMDEDQCLDQFRGSDRYGIDVAVLGDFEEVIGEARHRYELVCQGYATMTKGNSKITAYVGRTSTVLPITVTAIDARHDAATARGCIYSPATGRSTNCVSVDMSSSQTSRGWNHVRRISLAPLTAQQCKAMNRNAPRFTYRVVFSDRSGDTVMVADHRFSVVCGR